MEAVAENKVLSFVEGLQKPSNLTKTREEALQALNGMEFPTTRVEDWKYTRVGRLIKKTLKQNSISAAGVDNLKIEGLNANEIVFVNGYFDEEQSTIVEDDALNISPIDKISEEYYAEFIEDTEENVFSLINKAYQTGGINIKVSANKKLQKPIHLIHLIQGEETIANTRHFIHLERGSQAEIVTSFHSIDAAHSFTNVVLEGHLESNSNLRVNKIQRESKDVFHISNELFVQEKDSNFKINTVTTGGLLTRNGLNVLVEGENCHTEMNGVYLGTEKQHIDNHTLIDQMYSNCTSSETYKGVMDDKSVGVFNGKVIVRQDAQKIEAYQSNGNVLLSDTSTVNSKPELEIYADDVRCSHGSTIGQIDEEAIFYLRSRGISKENAKKLMVSAFIGDVLDNINNEAVRASVDNLFFEEYGWEF